MRLQFLAQVHECLLPYSEVRISKQRRFLQQQEAYPELKPHQRQEFETTCRKFLKDYRDFDSALLTTLKTAISQARKSRQDSPLRGALMRFRDHIEVMQQASLKRLRSRSSYSWNKGYLGK